MHNLMPVQFHALQYTRNCIDHHAVLLAEPHASICTDLYAGEHVGVHAC